MQSNTPEIIELLKPRYKVIADYPGNELFSIGEILSEFETVDECEFYKGDNTTVLKAYWKLENYPHLFRKLEWHECRKKEELPEYVRYQDEIFKAYAYGDEDVKVEEGKPKRFMAGGWIPLSSVKPTTKEEYETYNNQNPKP